MGQANIVELVFTRRSPKATRRSILAALFAIGTHAAVIGWAMSIPAPPPEKPTRKEYLVELEEPPKPPEPLAKLPPAPEPVTPVAPVPLPVKAPPQKTQAPPSVAPSDKPPPPAQAGNVVAQEPDANAPVDLSDNTFITGESTSFAGGTTAANGTNDKAVHTKETDPNGKPGGQAQAAPPVKTIDRSRSVSLDEDNWGCAWPREADSEQIDEQSVILKVDVDSRGKVTAAKLISDPGHGFGAAALACAIKTRFTPARDAGGEVIAAVSPPIRVRFTR